MSSYKYRDIVVYCRWCDFKMVLKQQTEITTIPLSWASNDRLYICPLLVRSPTGFRLPVNCHICSTSTPSLLPSVYTHPPPFIRTSVCGYWTLWWITRKNIHVKREQKKLCEEKKDNIENASSLEGSKNLPATFESSVTTLADFDLFILFVWRDFVCILQPLLTVLLLLTSTLPVFCTMNDPLSKHKEQFGWSFTQESITSHVLVGSSLQDSYLINLPISFGSTECQEI